MNIIYLIIGIIVGLAIGRVWKSREVSKATLDSSAAHPTGQAGFISESVEEKQKNLQKAREYLKGKTKITNDELQKALDVSDATIVRYLDDLEKEGLIKQVGKTGKYTYYEVVPAR